MRLKNYLGWLGQSSTNSIYVNPVGVNKKMLEIQTDSYWKSWKYLEALSELPPKQTTLLEKWRKDYNAEKSEEESFQTFLYNNRLIDVEMNNLNNENIRTVNFLSNFLNEPTGELAYNQMKQKSVAIIGLGTVGSALASNLVSMGLKKLTLIDGDIVEQKNLKHQRFFSRKDINRWKVEVVREKLLDIDPSLDIKILQNYFDSTMQSQLKNVDFVFCAFDKYEVEDLNSIIKVSKHAIIAGYGKQKVNARLLSQSVISQIEYDRHLLKEKISENAGVGFLGDIAAMLMIRLFIQIHKGLDFGFDYLSYDFINNTTTIWNEDSIDNINYPDQNSDFLINQNVVPLIDSLYRQWLNFDDEMALNEMNSLIEEYSISTDLDISPDEVNYTEKINTLTLEIDNIPYNVVEVLHFENVPLIIQKRLKNELFKMTKDALVAINIKKNELRQQYLTKLEQKKDIKKSIFDLSNYLGYLRFGNTIDAEKYNAHGYSNDVIPLTRQIEILSNTDSILSGYSMNHFLRFMLNHNFLNISKINNSSYQTFDSHFKQIYMTIKQEDSTLGLLDLAHEIGHGYFTQFLNPKIVEEISDDINEMFAFINEGIVLLSLLGNKQKLLQLNFDELIHYLYTTIHVNFSIDLLEEEVFTREYDLNDWDDIINIRHNVVNSLLSAEIKNLDLSDYNLVTNNDFLFHDRDFYLYSQSVLAGFGLAQIFVNDSKLYESFINFISKIDSTITLNQLIKETVQMDLSELIYQGGKDIKEYVASLQERTKYEKNGVK